MSTETINREVILPFQSRLFTGQGKFHITEISEFQAQAWHIGDTAIHFRSAVMASPLSREFNRYFVDLCELHPQIAAPVSHIFKQPKSQGHRREFTLAIFDLIESCDKPPLGFANLSVGLRQRDTGDVPWTFSIHIENACVSPVVSNNLSSNMLCAAIADLVYDEMGAIHRQAKAQGIAASLVVNMTYNATDAKLQLLADRVRPELESVRHLINHSNAESGRSGIHIHNSIANRSR